MSFKAYIPPSLVTRRRRLASNLWLDYAITEREKPKSLLVFMPSALDEARSERKRPAFARWSWANHFSNSTVISIADPSLAISPSLDAAWFLHDKYDVISLISQFIADYARANSIPEDKILFYGTSLGGFGAIACASLIPGSRASAEVPQVDVEKWLSDKPEQLAAIEKHLLSGKSLSQFRDAYAERVNLQDRFRKSGHVPKCLIHTNPGDQSYQDQKRLIEWIAESGIPNDGAELLITTRLSGHTHYQGTEGLKYIRPGQKLVHYPIASFLVKKPSVRTTFKRILGSSHSLTRRIVQSIKRKYFS